MTPTERWILPSTAIGDADPFKARLFAKQMKFQDEGLEEAQAKLDRQQKEMSCLKKLTAKSIKDSTDQISELKKQHKDEIYKMLDRLHTLEFKLSQLDSRTKKERLAHTANDSKLKTYIEDLNDQNKKL